MTDEELELKNLINDCGKEGICPLYSAFWGKPNAQSQFRRGHFKRAHSYKLREFEIGGEIFGAKLALIMESPPPKYSEYFYGPKGGSKKLFSNIARNLFQLEGIPAGLEDKSSLLKWIAENGLVIIDASKCRMKITSENILDKNEIDTEKISNAEIKKSFNSCAEILKLQLQVINPFRIAIGIASVYDHYINNEPYVLGILKEIGKEKAFVEKRTVSVFDRRGEGEFNNWFNEIWLRTKIELSNKEVVYI